MDYSAIPPDQLLTLWRTLNDGWPYKERNEVVHEMQRRKLFPENPINVAGPISTTLLDGGLYPDVEDPNFVARLLRKSEFADTISTFSPEENLCESDGPGFEVTPVQRFVATFMHPRTPYRSMLLYHGVGVGKTCAAIQAAEAYLDVYPRRPVWIVAPPNIQPGFRRTIFDIEQLRIGVGEEPNRMEGCTGDTYLRLTGCIYERDPKLIAFRVNKAIKYRYRFYGYLQFAGRIKKFMESIPKSGDPAVDEARLRDRMRNEFDYHFLVIDEAHNLADVKGTATAPKTAVKVEELDDVGTEEDQQEARAGKILTPYLRQLFTMTSGIKLLLMTATPMFNSVFEIRYLLNLMLLNDGKAEIPEGALLNRDGTLTATADAMLKPLANAYISFMRGENPNSFPLRLLPEGINPDGTPISRLTAETYPTYKLSQKENVEVDLDTKEYMSRLPIVTSQLVPGTTADIVLSALTIEKVKTSGTNLTVMNDLLQAGNCVYPNPDEDPSESPQQFVGSRGFDSVFAKKGRGVVECRGDPSWMALDNLPEYSPKLASIIQFLNNAEGVQFVYSRFVKTGAYTLALMLEANGYTPFGRRNYLENRIVSPGGRQCALCPNREETHGEQDHEFVPAVFVLLTGDKEISPKNEEGIRAARNLANKDGTIVKVVLGSTIAGEGIDLRCIRETHVLDAWFHLNKTEQIIGRGIRFRSHCALPLEKRNTTVYLHCVTFNPEEVDVETADLYCYRYALSKALLVGKVSRKLKMYAVDCNLRSGATVLKGLGSRPQIDAQRQIRGGAQGVSLDDMDYTVMCDWMECEYTCEPNLDINIQVSDDSTYDAFSSKYRETFLRKAIQSMFSRQPYFKAEDFINQILILDLPQSAIYFLLQQMINNRLFRITHANQEGYIGYKNGYFLFQPSRYKDLEIPMALRVADVPIKRDVFEPVPKEKMALPPVDGGVGMDNEPRSEQFWEMLKGWAIQVASGEITSVSIELERKLELYTLDFKQKQEAYKDKLDMIVWFSQRVPEDSRDVFSMVVLDYFWDEWVTTEQQKLLVRNPENEPIAGEQIITSGDVNAMRTINPATNFMEFQCGDGPCEGATADALMELSEAEKEVLRVDTRTTGSQYGFIVPKRGIHVFKINTPPPPTNDTPDKIRGGQEICPRSGTGYWKDPLLVLGKALVEDGHPSMEFDARHLSAPGDITNNLRGCTLVDLLLRYMDKRKIKGKRWFYRSVEAYLSGHRGIAVAEARLAAEALMKKEKEAAKERKKKTRAAETAAKKEAKAAAAAAKELAEPRHLRFKKLKKTAAAEAPAEGPLGVKKPKSKAAPAPVLEEEGPAPSAGILRTRIPKSKAVEEPPVATSAAAPPADAPGTSEAFATSAPADVAATSEAEPPVATSAAAPPANAPATSEAFAAEPQVATSAAAPPAEVVDEFIFTGLPAPAGDGYGAAGPPPEADAAAAAAAKAEANKRKKAKALLKAAKSQKSRPKNEGEYE